MKKNELILYNITKEFQLTNSKSEKIKALFGISKFENFAALRGVTIKAKQGEILGIIGLNGSGKSTLLNIISEVFPPTTGIRRINGKISLLSVSSGLKGSLTGRENISYKLLLEGLKPKQIKARVDEIIEFSELHEHIDMPLKTYSSGMKAKLGFAISASVKPDILIIDESLAVGDATFLNKCIKVIEDFKKEGKIIIFVSHSLGQVKQLCERTLWLHYGKIAKVGKTNEVIKAYQMFLEDFKKLSNEEQQEYKKIKKQEQTNFDIKKYNLKLVNSFERLSMDQKKIIFKSLNNPIFKNKINFIELIILIIGIALIISGIVILAK